MKKKGFDFSGWVTRNDIRCSDGVVIKHNAFLGNDNKTVPLVWNHDHSNPSNVIGKILLKNVKDGVYGYGELNNTQTGKDAKELLQHGDIVSMSIAANKIKRTSSNDIIHGNIYEVSLVLAGANPGASIESVIAHSEDDGEAAIIYTDYIVHSSNYEEDFLYHAEEDEKNKGETKKMDNNNQKIDGVEDLSKEILDALSEEDKAKIAKFIQDRLPEGANPEEADKYLSEEDMDELSKMIEKMIDDIETDDVEGVQNQPANRQSIQQSDNINLKGVDQILHSINANEANDIITFTRGLTGDINSDPDDLMHSLNDEEAYIVNGYVYNTYADKYLDKITHSNGGNEMRRNLFESNVVNLDNSEELTELKHSMVEEMKDGETLKSVFKSHESELLEHGITNIDKLFTVEPVTGAPGFIRPEEPSLVSKILNGIKTTPRHTVHGRWADITEKEARARGYIKGKEKLEEVFNTLNRITHPQTVYKKQSFDRDDWVDIDDFDLVQWIKPEMEEMLKYELARAVLVGDGREASDGDKIKETSIRPIATDDKLFATKVYDVTADKFVETFKRNRNKYKGTGRPTLFIDGELANDVELLKSNDGKYLYGVGNRPATDEELAQLVDCVECICPEFMEGTGLAIKVNLADYEFAVPSKGKTTMYDDFDIDYNKMKYLIETRLAGALNKPYAAVVLSTKSAPLGA